MVKRRIAEIVESVDMSLLAAFIDGAYKLAASSSLLLANDGCTNGHFG